MFAHRGVILNNTELKRKIIQYKENNPKLSSRKISKVFNVSKSTVNNYWAEYQRGDFTLEESPEPSQEFLTDSELEKLTTSEDYHVANLAKRLRTAQRTNTQLRKVLNGAFDDDSPEIEVVIDKLSQNLQDKFYSHTPTPAKKPSEQVTVEILFSDLQIGKISESWNTEIAKRTLRYYGQEVLREVKDANPERIIFSSLGDVCECMLKHGVQSAVSTDTSNAEQMANAIEVIWWEVLAPLIALNIPMEIVGVQGNHLSSTGKGMDMFKAGRYGYDYVMYKAWENLVKVLGAKHVSFNIPEGNFATYEIYGKLTVAEHGYEAKGSSESALMTLRTKRATNLQRYVHRLVVGDLHHYCSYDNGNMIVNGAFFGVAEDAIEYSGIMGYHAVPAQVIVIHTPTTGVGQNTVKEIKVVQVAKGYHYSY